MSDHKFWLGAPGAWAVDGARLMAIRRTCEVSGDFNGMREARGDLWAMFEWPDDWNPLEGGDSYDIAAFTIPLTLSRDTTFGITGPWQIRSVALRLDVYGHRFCELTLRQHSNGDVFNIERLTGPPIDCNVPGWQ